MFDFNIIIQRLNDLSNWKNTVIANSKKIFQLPIATAGVKKIAVHNETSFVTEQFNLTDALNGFNLLNDKITAYGTVTRVGNTFTYSVGYTWILGGLNYANTSDIDILVNEATDGFYRTDIVVVDTNNQIYLIEGFESDSVASQPQTPPDTLLLDIFNIFGDVIDNPLSYPNLNLTSENFGQFIDLLPYKGTIIDDDKLIIGNSEESGKAFYTKAISFAEYLIIKFAELFLPLNPRVQTVTSSATVTPTHTNDIVTITAQATGLTLANPTGAFAEGQSLMIRIKDNGTARSITFGSNYRAIGITLPTTTVISKTLYLGIIYNDTDSKWDVLGINQEA